MNVIVEPRPSAAATRNPWIAVTMLLMGAFVVGANTTMVNVAITPTTETLHASLSETLWIVNAYLLAFVALLPVSGRLGDLYGPKLLHLSGLASFAVGSAVGFIAPDVGWLVFGRAVQGLGAALVTPQAIAMIARLFPADRRGRVFGVWGVIAGLAVAAGPILGGLVVATLGWRWIYGAAGVVAAVAFAFSLTWLPKLISARRPRLDLLGTVLLTSALSLVVYGLIEGEPRHWAQPIPAVIGIGLVIFVVFAVVQFRQRDREPLVPMTVVRSPGFALMSVVSAALTCAVAAMVFLTAIFLQSVAGLDAFETGLVIAVAPLTSLPFALLSGWLTDRYGGFLPLLIGLLLMTTGLASFPLALANSFSLLPALVVFGIGMGIVYAPPGTLAMAHIDPALAGAASGTMNTLRALGNSLTSAVVAAWLQIRLADVPTGLQVASDGLTSALAGTYWIPVVVLAIATLACVLRARTLSARG